ncbi:MAG: hypothetical protein FWH29_00235 [Methanobrevibacter sp.]|nr:hypothetical protein [Methanobrevibacter sp.]
MPQDYWINLPVKNLKKSKEFFEKIGFVAKENFVHDMTNVQLSIGEKEVYIMLFEKDIFQHFSRTAVANTEKSAEIIFSIGVETKEEVDEIYEKAIANGGKSFAPPENIGEMYGCGFCDLDDHRWNILYVEKAI